MGRGGIIEMGLIGLGHHKQEESKALWRNRDRHTFPLRMDTFYISSFSPSYASYLECSAQ